MCLSKVYLKRDSEKSLLMEDVASVEHQGDRLLLKTLFGEEKEVAASIRQVDLVSNAIVLEETV